MIPTESMVASLISGFFQGADMLIEMVKQNPWFFAWMFFCMLLPARKTRKR